MADLTCWSSS